VFVTYQEGTVSGKEMTLAEELEYDRKHWVDEYGIKFRIGVTETKPAAKGKRRENPYFFETYSANAFPTYILVDRKGVVRFVQIGHREDLEAKFGALIERYLGEASGTR
jgi:hypothetical protein